jgi:hypothetical protein
MDTAVRYIRERFQVNWPVVRESLKSSNVVRSAIGGCVREPVEVVRVFEEL